MKTEQFELNSKNYDYENEVFISYAWGGESEDIVNELETQFKSHGIRMIRDKKELEYKGSIETFERRIGKGQFIVIIISDKYLRSEHCMYELVQIHDNKKIRERVFPIVLEDARIYKAIDRLNYIKYWDEQTEQLNQAIKQIGVMTNLSGIAADLDKYAYIRASFDYITDLLSDMNALTPNTHSNNGFSIIIDQIKLSTTNNRPNLPPSTSHNSPMAEELSTFSIVVADDVQEVVNAVSTDLIILAKKHNKKIRIFKAITGSEVIALAESHRIDAFFLDYMFEYGMTGDEIIQGISDPFKSKFFILMSGWKEEVLEKIIVENHHLLKSRCRFLRKPFDHLSLQAIFLEMFLFHDTNPYPMPVNYSYELVLHSSGIDKALALKAFYETLLRFSVFTLMVDILKNDFSNKLMNYFCSGDYLSYNTLAEWLNELLEIYETHKEAVFLPEIIEFYRNNEINPLTAISNFIASRFSSGLVKETEWYDVAEEEYEKDFQIISLRLRFLSRYSLIVPEKVEILPEISEGYKYQVRLLNGSDAIAEKIELTSTARMSLYSIYLYSPIEDVLSLSPFIVFKTCPSCNIRKIYFLERVQHSTLFYRSFCNHNTLIALEKSIQDKKFFLDGK